MRPAPLLTPLLALVSCAAGKLPTDLAPPTRCVYEVLKAAPDIEEPSVYAIENAGVVIAFGYRAAAGKDETHEIFVTRRALDGEFIASGDYPAYPALAKTLSDRFTTQCRINVGYVDQVAITGPNDDPSRWFVDMSKIKK